MKKVLFVIHDLHVGGAEKVLVNLVNHMDPAKFDVTVLALFSGGVNEQFLSPNIRLLHGHKHAFRGNSHIMKFFSPQFLFQHYIKEKYDIIVSYLEGPSARIVSGCPHDGTKLVCWIHIEQHTPQKASSSFCSFSESQQCYQRFNKIICVSESVAADFHSLYPLTSFPSVLYNTVESAVIRTKSHEPIDAGLFVEGEYALVGVGKIVSSKGFDRLLRIHHRLRKENNLPIHTYILGTGAESPHLEAWVRSHEEEKFVTFLGYQTNPYKYVAASDLFVCASHAEGFSTAATEALIVGTPVITTEVSGMREMLGNNEYGVITENNEDALYRGIKDMLVIPGKLDYYREKAKERGSYFSTEQTVCAVEKMLEQL